MSKAYLAELKRWCKQIGYTPNEIDKLTSEQMYRALKRYGYKMKPFDKLKG